MKARATIEVDCGDNSAARNVRDAVSHEGNIGKRSRASIDVSGPKVVIKIDADDVVALRATINSLMRGIQLIENARGKVFSKERK